METRKLSARLMWPDIANILWTTNIGSEPQLWNNRNLLDPLLIESILKVSNNLVIIKKPIINSKTRKTYPVLENYFANTRHLHPDYQNKGVS